ncbi:MAG: hypothetical protein MZW92_68400 [Comamonadaceae bacterium]|nr:hypothetical protein [Comamonadaceae bacterium]
MVGGLYGNERALDTVEALAAAERGPVTIVFNGDFNWFNVDSAAFRRINERVLGHAALLGNVEYELAHGDGERGLRLRLSRCGGRRHGCPFQRNP